MVAKASTQKTSIERCYKLCGPVDPWIQSNSGKVCEHGYSLEWLCSFLKFFQVMELLESMQLSCIDQFGTKVKFSAGYTKIHSLPFKNFPIDGKTITKNGNWVSPVCQFVSLKGTIQADVIKSWGRTKTNYRQGPHSKTLIFQNRTQRR